MKVRHLKRRRWLRDDTHIWYRGTRREVVHPPWCLRDLSGIEKRVLAQVAETPRHYDPRLAVVTGRDIDTFSKNLDNCLAAVRGLFK